MRYGVCTFDPHVLAEESDAEISALLHSPNRLDELERLEANRPNLLADCIEHSHDYEMLKFLAEAGDRRTRFAATTVLHSIRRIA